MRVLVTGAYGLIGAACLARLHVAGHEVVAAGRSLRSARRRLPYAQWIAADFRRLASAEAWQPLLQGIDAVVNCVGVLQDGWRDDVQRIQQAGTVALFDACQRAGRPGSQHWGQQRATCQRATGQCATGGRTIAWRSSGDRRCNRAQLGCWPIERSGSGHCRYQDQPDPGGRAPGYDVLFQNAD